MGINMNRTLTILLASACSLFAYTERELIASCLYQEARGEGVYGMELVANVIQNRAIEYGVSYSEVVTKRNQFSCFNNGVKIKYDFASDLVARRLLAGKIEDHTNGAYFYQRNELPRRKWHGQKTLTYKHHTFFKKI